MMRLAKGIAWLIAAVTALIFAVMYTAESPRSLVEAVCKGDIFGTIRLIASDADPNVMVPNGKSEMTPLISAVDDVTCPKMLPSLWIRTLVSYGADVNLATSAGFTPVMASISSGNLWAAEYLISKGAHVNASDHRGETALMIAATINSRSSVQLLKTMGGDLRQANKSGKTAYDLAAENENTDLLPLLQ